MNIKRNIIFALESRKKNGVPITENVPIRMRVEKPLNFDPFGHAELSLFAKI